jgi:hypothetical protein
LQPDYLAGDSTIGKTPRANACDFVLYFRLAFIFSKLRAIMVNGFARARVNHVLAAHMNPVLSRYLYKRPQIIPCGGVDAKPA